MSKGQTSRTKHAEIPVPGSVSKTSNESRIVVENYMYSESDSAVGALIGNV